MKIQEININSPVTQLKNCGYENNRDYNAAMNIRDCGTRLLAW